MGNIARPIATFESELSLGPTGDTIFLECRHRIITAIYRPNQTISADQIAQTYDVPGSVGDKVLRALLDHGYIEQPLGEPPRVIYWADQYFVDMLETCRELMTLAIAKCAKRVTDVELGRLREAVDFAFSSAISPLELESFHIRWWIYFQMIIATVELNNFRKSMLTSMPAAIRRRVLTSMEPKDLSALLSAMKDLLAALETHDEAESAKIVSGQFSNFGTTAFQQNRHYNALRDDSEIDYADTRLPERPIFRTANDPRPDFDMGVREPTSWEAYKDLDLL